MINRKALYLASFVAIALPSAGVCGDEQPSRLSADLKVEIDGPLLTEFPLLLKITITNTGKQPFYYWCGGPGRYPNANPFLLTATDTRGQSRKLCLHNGQYTEGSGYMPAIETTQSLPAACDPLPAGTYTLNVASKADYRDENGRKRLARPAMSSKSIKVTVVEDRVALDAANSRLRDREKDDPFAEHVAKVYSIDPIVQSAFGELLSDDPKTVLEGIYHLRVKRLPPGGGDRLKEVVKTLCRSDRKTDPRILREISFNCRAIETDEAVDVMAIIANSAPNVDICRTGAVVDLAMVPGPHAEKVLLDLVANKDSPVYWEALGWLGSRHSKAVIQPLLLTAADPKSEKRLVAIRVLGRFFRDRPDATSALDAALHDKDPEVRKTAKEAIEWKDIDPEMLSDW